jgi:hypothetical protein
LSLALSLVFSLAGRLVLGLRLSMILGRSLSLVLNRSLSSRLSLRLSCRLRFLRRLSVGLRWDVRYNIDAAAVASNCQEPPARTAAVLGVAGHMGRVGDEDQAQAEEAA